MRPERAQVPAPGIYAGVVQHRRFGTPAHALSYRVCYLLLDPAAGAAQAGGSWLFGWNRRRWFSYHDADHGPDRATRFVDDIAQLLRAAGINPDGCEYRVLCLPRMLGYVFNPITVVYCFAPDGIPRAMIYEVNNTFGERVHYVLPVDGPGAAIEQHCDKAMFVSPFFDTDGHYRFRLDVPGERLGMVIDYHTDRLRLRASFQGQRRPLNPATLRRLALTHSLDALKVIAGIHYEALKLWLKRVPLRRHVPRADITLKPGTPT